MFFDTHAHYDNGAFNADRDEVLQGLAAKGVDLVVCPGSDLESSRTCVELAGRYPFLYAAVGVHPHEAEKVPANWLEELEALAGQPKVVAIGEVGLDYYYDHSPRPVQQEAFRAQLALADRLDLPVIVHDREAHRDCLEIVREFPGVRGVYHCYSGGVEDAKTLVSLGWMLSFTGSITFKNAKKALEVIDRLPMDRMMIETDSPYLTPEPWRGQRCDSTMIARSAETVAQLRGLTRDEVEHITLENGKRFFRIS